MMGVNQLNVGMKYQKFKPRDRLVKKKLRLKQFVYKKYKVVYIKYKNRLKKIKTMIKCP